MSLSKRPKKLCTCFCKKMWWILSEPRTVDSHLPSTRTRTADPNPNHQPNSPIEDSGVHLYLNRLNGTFGGPGGFPVSLGLINPKWGWGVGESVFSFEIWHAHALMMLSVRTQEWRPEPTVCRSLSSLCGACTHCHETSTSGFVSAMCFKTNLDCYWVGSLDFNFLGKSTGFH